MNYGQGRRPCELNDHDVREHVDWMTRYSDEAWRALERRVNKMEPKLKALAVSEDNCQTLKEVLREMQKRNHAEIEQLKRNVSILTGQHSEMHEDFRDMRMHVRTIQRQTGLIDENCTHNIEELRNNYTRINTSVGTIGDNVQEFKDRFNHANGEVNRLNTLIQASSEDIRQFKRTINHKVDEIGNNENKIQKKNAQEVEELKRFMNEKIIQCKECVRKEIKDNLNPVNIRISAIENEIRQCMTKITENDNLNKEEIKTISEKIDNNTRSIRKQINQTKEKCQNLKDGISKIKNQQDKLEKSILLKANHTEINSQIKTLTDKVRKVEEKDKSVREALEKMDVRMQEKAEEMEVLSNKVTGLLEKNEGTKMRLPEVEEKEMSLLKIEEEEMKLLKIEEEEMKLRKIEEEEMQLRKIKNKEQDLKSQEMQRKEELEKLVDMQTPHRHRFRLQPNTITLQQQGDDWYQVLLKKVLPKKGPFVLVANIISSKCGFLRIGVVDRRTQKEEQSSFLSNNAVCYGPHTTTYGINYANNGKHSFKRTGIALKAGRELRVKVELDKGMATFTIDGKDFPVRSDILSGPNRQFVPYFEMEDKGDSVEWRME